MTSSSIRDDAGAPETLAKPRELDLFAFALLLLRNLKFILGCGLVCFLLMLVVMLRTKPLFSSTAVMVVPQGNVASAGLQAQLSLSTLDLLGGGYELYADILNSRTVADRLIKDHNLEKAYGSPELIFAEITLAAMTHVQTQREGLIRVTVSDTDPQRAADLANDYLHQLDVLNSQLVLTSIGQQREYLEREMTKEKNSLADAEVALKQVQESTSGLAPDAEANAGLSALESTRAQLRASQIRLASLLTGETDANPEVVRLRQEIASLNGQLESLQRGSNSSENGVPTSQVPEKTLEYTRRLREVKFHETLFDLLEKQFEQAKQQEAKTPSIVQVLDPAVPVWHKSAPPRTYNCVLAAIVGTLAGIVLVIARALALAYARNPNNAEKLVLLRNLYSKKSGR